MKREEKGGSSKKGRTASFVVHRCKFVDYVYPAVTFLSADPYSSRKQFGCVRRSGDVELWGCWNNRWYCEKTIYGLSDLVPTSLFWIRRSSKASQDRNTSQVEDVWSRLFTCYLNGEIVEWDLYSLRSINRTDLGGGSIHCASQCPTDDSLFAIGSEDGKVRLARAGSYVELVEVSESIGSRVLCLDWISDGSSIVCGGEEGRVVRIDVKTGRVSDLMKLQNRSRKMVWSIKCLSSGFFVTGDSSGAITFWELQNNLPTHSFQSHDADILCIDSNCSGTTVWSAGVDLKVVRYTLHHKTDHGKTWILNGQKKYHSHDINAILYIEGDSDVLISGGMDSGIVYINRTKDFPNVKPYRLPCYPTKPIIQIERRRRLLLMRYPDSIKFWQLPRKGVHETTEPSNPNKGDGPREKLVLHFKPSLSSNICSAAISKNSEWIAISDTKRTEIYRFTLDLALLSDKKCLTKAKFLLKTELPAGQVLAFLGKEKLIIGTHSSKLCIVNLKAGSDPLVNPLLEPLYGRENSTMVSLVSSQDGRWFACGFSNNIICVYNASTMELTATLDSFLSLHTSISFRPKLNEIVITLISNEFYIYNLTEKRFTEWPSGDSAPLSRWWPNKFGFIMGSASPPINKDLLVLYGPESTCFVSTKNCSAKEKLTPSIKTSTLKRKHELVGDAKSNGTGQLQMKVEHRYGPLMALGFLSDTEIVVVEHPILRFLNALPPSFTKRTFGT